MPDQGNESGLRIAYAGFVQFLTQLVGLGTGLLFVTLITRNLTVSDFGLWQVIGSAVGIALLPATVVTFWNLRGVARRQDIGRTSMVAGMLTLPMTFAILLAVSTGVGSRIELVGFVVIAALSQLPFMVLLESVKGTVQATRPAILGYSSVFFEITKVAVAFYLVIMLKVGLYGAILALALAYAIQDVIIILSVKGNLGGRIDFGLIKQWVRASWVPLFDRGVSRIWSSDAILVALLLGSAEPVGLFQGPRVFTAIIMYSEIFLRVLYPKLIRDRLSADVGVAFRLQTMLEVPMVVGAVVLAGDLLSVLGPDYVSSAFLLQLLALVAVVESAERVMYFVLYGAETVDSKRDGYSFKNLKSSWLVKLPLLDLSKSVVYMVVLAGALYLFATPSRPEFSALIWGIVYAIITVPYAVMKTIFARKFFPHTMPWAQIIKYAVAGVAMGITLMLIRGTTPSEISVISAIIRLGYLVSLGALVYFGIVALIDSHFRGMVRNLIKKQ
ncbi:MAG: hypothetical protein HYY67_04955 [Thaumarchaeota archaeon]|nr:hypothetical protein [Nitrososphaerota archaeon]